MSNGRKLLIGMSVSAALFGVGIAVDHQDAPASKTAPTFTQPGNVVKHIGDDAGNAITNVGNRVGKLQK